MLRISLAFLLLLASQLLSAAPQLHALPVLTGIDVGAISISATGAVVEINTLETAGNTTLRNWNDFNIGETALVNFHTDPSSSLTVNRINNTSTSTINGILNANSGSGISEVRIDSGMLLNNDVNLSVSGGNIVLESGIFSGDSVTISAGTNIDVYDFGNDVTLTYLSNGWFGTNSIHTNFTIVQTVVPLPAAFYLFLTAFAYLIRFSSKNNYSGN